MCSYELVIVARPDAAGLMILIIFLFFRAFGHTNVAYEPFYGVQDNAMNI